MTAPDDWQTVVDSLQEALAEEREAAYYAQTEWKAADARLEALRTEIERHIAAAPVMRFDNDYPVKAVPVAELFAMLALAADTTVAELTQRSGSGATQTGAGGTP
jgi:hypothetical protein